MDQNQKDRAGSSYLVVLGLNESLGFDFRSELFTSISINSYGYPKAMDPLDRHRHISANYHTDTTPAKA